jgi:hypothetical protein
MTTPPFPALHGTMLVANILTFDSDTSNKVISADNPTEYYNLDTTTACFNASRGIDLYKGIEIELLDENSENKELVTLIKDKSKCCTMTLEGYGNVESILILHPFDEILPLFIAASNIRNLKVHGIEQFRRLSNCSSLDTSFVIKNGEVLGFTDLLYDKCDGVSCDIPYCRCKAANI